ncbi:putative transcriptional regulator [Drepanopeziza brunnea f. sp. 'multigermtubi' MB_m1]|uniref:Putative transcriptional regulator n=1 Tax=Marssonina brunnea f. sp. multigermtubi (strain MB_m1) TaxID=1072389 RepID=K1WU80_MARBU|nr:putative transcriptional regulator [Drepanopeziza brunnea f. sp. 'multigermtubi' MB_m1]EKD21200.1 putative transcriptional regulator [Drepanopeziza brunnea f. sp. 'multigermtubi' MB_m1]
MEYKPLLPASPTRPAGPAFDSLQVKLSALQQNFSLQTLLLIGACIQSLLFLLPIPRFYSVGPAVALLLFRIIKTFLITYNIIPNPYMTNAILQKSTAQPRDLNGNFTGPGKQKVAVMFLGAKSNHPLGVFEPGFARVGGFLKKMTEELNGAETQDSGFLGQSATTRTDANGTTERILISYWRSLQDIHNFAYGPTHLAAWRWWNSSLKSLDHVGIMHEVYEADAGMWEGLYVNFQPTLLGSTTYLKKDGKLVGGEVGDEWVSPLLDANRGKLRTSNGRRGLMDKKANLDAVYGERAVESYETI